MNGLSAQKVSFFLSLLWLVLVPFSIDAKSLYEGPLPDFTGDRLNKVMDARIGNFLRPLLPGKDFEWPSAAHVDWNDDGLFDLVVGYNLRSPDVIRMVVYLNQGSLGKPKFTGVDSPSTCFYLEVVYPEETEPRIFEDLGWHKGHRPHNWIVHNPGIYDFNKDGLFDILVNENTYDPQQRRGQWLLLNFGNRGQPRFRAVYLHYNDYEKTLPAAPYVEALNIFNVLPGEMAGSYPVFNLIDWDSDGIPDIHHSTGSAYIFYGSIDDGNWHGLYDQWSKVAPTDEKFFGFKPHMVTVDFNADGINELLVADARINRWEGGEYKSDGFLTLFVQDPAAENVQYIRAIPRLGSLNSDDNPSWLPKHGWWHPRIAAVDFDEDGDQDILAGWGGGNGRPQLGVGIYLYRTPGGVPGSHPLYSIPPSSPSNLLVR